MAAFLVVAVISAQATDIGTGETISITDASLSGGQNINFDATLTHITTGSLSNTDTDAGLVNLSPPGSPEHDFTGSLGTGPGQVQWSGRGGFTSTNFSSVVNIGGLAVPATLTWGSGGFVPDGSTLVMAGSSIFENNIDLGSDPNVTRQIDVGGSPLFTGHITGAGNLTLQTYGIRGSNLVLHGGPTGPGSIDIAGKLTLENVVLPLSGIITAGSIDFRDHSNVLPEVLGTPDITMSGGSIWGVFPGNFVTPFNQQVGDLESTDPTSIIDLPSGESDTMTVHSDYYAGQIIDGSPSSGKTGGLIKDGAGTFTLATAAARPGLQTYSGGTTVKGGTLLVRNTAGSATGSGAITVMGGAKFGGSGFVAPTGASAFVVQDGGSIDLSAIDALHPPAALIDTLTILLSSGSKANFETGSFFVFDVGAGGTSDKLAFEGQTAPGAGPSVIFNDNQVDLHFLGSVEDGTYTLFTFDHTGLYSGLLQSSAGYTFNYDATDISVTVSGVAAVPEPSTTAFLFAGLGLLFLRRLRARWARG